MYIKNYTSKNNINIYNLEWMIDGKKEKGKITLCLPRDIFTAAVHVKCSLPIGAVAPQGQRSSSHPRNAAASRRLSPPPSLPGRTPSPPTALSSRRTRATATSPVAIPSSAMRRHILLPLLLPPPRLLLHELVRLEGRQQHLPVRRHGGVERDERAALPVSDVVGARRQARPLPRRGVAQVQRLVTVVVVAAVEDEAVAVVEDLVTLVQLLAHDEAEPGAAVCRAPAASGGRRSAACGARGRCS